MAYTTIDDPSAYFQTVLFASKGAITFDGSSDLQPDMIWNKNRDSAGYSHHIVDSVRGVSKLLRVDSSIAEFTSADSITSLNTDGFTIGNDANGYMQSGSDKIVTWGWKAGTSFSNDASSTGIGSIDSVGSVSTDAGFSITSYTGTGSAGTIKHGLSVAPSMVIIKNRDDGQSWRVGVTSVGFDKYLGLNGTGAATSSSGMFNNTAPTTSVFSVGSDGSTNASGEKCIAYCFADVKGYSKIGSYTGNGSTDGSYIHCGFKPAWVMIKRTDGANSWVIYDNKREGYNVDNDALQANGTNAEGTSDDIDLLSSGFKMRTSGVGENGSGNSYIYMAFAESPFTNSNGVPNNAR